MATTPEKQLKEECIAGMTEHLAALRTMLHLTQEDLAGLIGVARTTVLYIEKRTRKMTWNTYLSLAFLFIQNKETGELLQLFNIYPDRLKKMYSDLNA